MGRALHELARLHAAELGERAIRRLVAPDALAGREHRVAAVALLVVAVILVAVDDDLVTDLPALHLGADRPDDARGIGAGDVEGLLVHVERRDRQAESRPHAVVVDSGGHHEDQHLVLADRMGRYDFELHRLFGRAVAVTANHPGIHVLRHMAERRDLADFVEILLGLVRRRVLAHRKSNNGHCLGLLSQCGNVIAAGARVQRTIYRTLRMDLWNNNKITHTLRKSCVARRRGEGHAPDR
jgi:hypothetical protein